MGMRKNHTNESKAKVAMAAMREDRTLSEVAGPANCLRSLGDARKTGDLVKASVERKNRIDL